MTKFVPTEPGPCAPFGQENCLFWITGFNGPEIVMEDFRSRRFHCLRMVDVGVHRECLSIIAPVTPPDVVQEMCEALTRMADTVERVGGRGEELDAARAVLAKLGKVGA